MNLSNSPNPISLTLSLAEHDFSTTKSLGIHHVTQGILATLAGRSDIDLRVLASPAWEPTRTRHPQVPWHTFNYPLWNRLGRIWWDQVGLYEAMRGRPREWLLLAKGFAPLRRPPCRLAVLVYDAMHDHYRRCHPGRFPVGENLYFLKGLHSMLKRAELIFTISQFTATEMTRLLEQENGASHPRIIHVGIGFEPVVRSPSPGLKTGDLLVYSSPLPHKLTALAVQYLDRWQTESGFSGSIHWVGKWPPSLPFPSHPRWIRHGRISDTQHEQLLDSAAVSVFFSEYEGFGMPPVEAVIHGASPVFSDIPATREVMGACGCRFLNADYESFFAALESARHTSREQIDAWRKELLARHDWAVVGDRLLTALVDL